jgi:hypothetical protein
VVRSFRKLLLTWLVRKGLMDGMQRYKRGWFMYFQDDDGAIPVAFHAKEDDPSSTNFKKRIISDIQADFKRKGSRKEADPTSTHRSRYMYMYLLGRMLKQISLKLTLTLIGGRGGRPTTKLVGQTQPMTRTAK